MVAERTVLVALVPRADAVVKSRRTELRHRLCSHGASGNALLSLFESCSENENILTIEGGLLTSVVL